MKVITNAALWLYGLCTIILNPFIRLYVTRIWKNAGYDLSRLGEPFMVGVEHSRAGGRLIWLHAASVGEFNSIVPLLKKLQAAYPNFIILLTTVTKDSYTIFAKLQLPGVIHQYAPVDSKTVVQEFLSYWQPELAIFVDSEIWPNMLLLTEKVCPILLVNARVSPKSWARWKRFNPIIRRLLQCFVLILPQSPEDQERFRTLGGAELESKLKLVGNLKYAIPDLDYKETELATLKQAITGRKTWVAASTHPGEEVIIARVHLALQGSCNLLTVIVPRNPERGWQIAEALRTLKLEVAVRSKGDQILPTTNIYLMDTLGEMGLAYRLAPLAFIGGTFAEIGGHNPLEPAKLGVVTLIGPHYFNFQAVIDDMRKCGIARLVRTREELQKALEELLNNVQELLKVESKAKEYMANKEAVLENVFQTIATFIRA